MLHCAQRLYELAEKQWGPNAAVPMIGRHPRFAEALDRVARLAGADAPVLIMGETGTGKELFARAVFLLARNNRRVFVPVNCGQYTNEDVMVSELFGHRKASFTGATTDHRGVFEDADGGTVFLDEVGELTARAQVMLLRVLSEGEIMPMGGTRPSPVDVRVVAATNRDLLAMVRTGEFRQDLYFRLQRLKVPVPPLRKRGQDWLLIAGRLLERLSQEAQTMKQLAPEAVAQLDRYAWPGNVREVLGCVETGFHLSRDSEIGFDDFAEALETTPADSRFGRASLGVATEYGRLLEQGEGDFWNLVYEPYMARELNRTQVRELIADGLQRVGGSYKRLLTAFGITEQDYLKFMDFLRYHRLKPETHWRRALLRGEVANIPVYTANGR